LNGVDGAPVAVPLLELPICFAFDAVEAGGSKRRSGDRHLLLPGTGTFVFTFVLPVLPFLVRRGFHPRLGARPLRDAVEKYVGDAVVRDLIAGGTGSCEIAVDAGRERLWVG
jgi:hypothetical protein